MRAVLMLNSPSWICPWPGLALYAEPTEPPLRQRRRRTAARRWHGAGGWTCWSAAAPHVALRRAERPRPRRRTACRGRRWPDTIAVASRYGRWPWRDRWLLRLRRSPKAAHGRRRRGCRRTPRRVPALVQRAAESWLWVVAHGGHGAGRVAPARSGHSWGLPVPSTSGGVVSR